MPTPQLSNSEKAEKAENAEKASLKTATDTGQGRPLGFSVWGVKSKCVLQDESRLFCERFLLPASLERLFAAARGMLVQVQVQRLNLSLEAVLQLL